MSTWKKAGNLLLGAVLASFILMGATKGWLWGKPQQVIQILHREQIPERFLEKDPDVCAIWMRPRSFLGFEIAETLTLVRLQKPHRYEFLDSSGKWLPLPKEVSIAPPKINPFFLKEE